MRLRGSVTVEAALVFPFLLAAIFSLFFLIKVVYIHQQIQYALNQTAEEISSKAYLMDKPGFIDLQQQIYDKISGAGAQLEAGTALVENSLDNLSDVELFQGDFTNGGDWSEGNRALDTIIPLIEELYHFSTEMMIIYQNLTEGASGVLSLLGGAEAMELLNNQLGTLAVRQRFKTMFSDELLMIWGIRGGINGFDFDGSEFMLRDDDILLTAYYEIGLPISILQLEYLPMVQQARVRAFSGNGNFASRYDKKEEVEEGQTNKDMVYVTRTGEKYHLNRSCPYILVPVHAMPYSTVKDSRRICEVCEKQGPKVFDIVYGTLKSDIYHTMKNCYTISREVFTVSLDEAISQGRTLCKKCEEEDHEQ